MRNIIYNGEVYPRVFKYSDYILKYSTQKRDAWDALSHKNLPFLNKPMWYFDLCDDEKVEFSNCLSKIYLPYLSGYETLYNNTFMSNVSDLDILLLLKKMLLMMKEMHSQDVYHGDISSSNIMISNNFNVSFIDLCASIIDDFVGFENTYFDDDITIDEMKSNTVIDDKMELFRMFLYYFVKGRFNYGVDYRIEYSKLGLCDSLVKEISSYRNSYGSSGVGQIPSKDYYFIDIVDELISKGYEFSYKKNNL